MKKYEYNQLYVSIPEDGINHLDKLNALGKDGWELIQMQQYDNRNYVYIFKKELQESKKTLLMEEKKNG